jgi:5-oxoprolinase (ATP-hydrolysing) subunit B
VTTHIAPYGEGAVLVVLGDAVELATARRARRLTSDVSSLRPSIDGLGVPVQGIASVLVPFDPVVASADDLIAHLAPLVSALPDDPGPDADSHLIDIPVCYGGEDGPDLDEVADLTGLSPADVIERHVAEVLEVLTLGFAPGFPYLGLIDPMLAVPRRATPRPRVAGGSVGLAGRMTGIYPTDLPGGWRIIGRTERPLFDPRADPPALLRPGDRVRFVPVTAR